MVEPSIESPQLVLQQLATFEQLFRQVTGGSPNDLKFQDIRRLLAAIQGAEADGRGQGHGLRAEMYRLIELWKKERESAAKAEEQKYARFKEAQRTIEELRLQLSECEAERDDAARSRPATEALSLVTVAERAGLRFQPVQLYETTIMDVSSHRSFFFCTVPARSLPEQRIILVDSQGWRQGESKEYLLSELDLDELFEIDSYQLKGALAGHLSEAAELHYPVTDTSWRAQKEATLRALLLQPDNPLVAKTAAFSGYLIQADIVPFECSPLAGVSLQELLKATGVATGAYIGFVIAGSTPLLLIAVPAGMILCGAASGIAHGLEEGLRERVKRLVDGTRRATSTPA